MMLAYLLTVVKGNKVQQQQLVFLLAIIASLVPILLLHLPVTDSMPRSQQQLLRTSICVHKGKLKVSQIIQNVQLSLVGPADDQGC
jgi:hypothetical protein